MIPKVQIRVEKWVAYKDAAGDAKERIDISYPLFAEILNSSGSRSDTNGQMKLNKTKTFKIRFRPDWKINGMWKLIHKGMRYSINQIKPLDEKRFNWIINCESPETVA